jgi:hypothetical protein
MPDVGKAYLRQADGDYVMSPQEAAQLAAMQDRPLNESKSMNGLPTSARASMTSAAVWPCAA